MKKGPEVVVKWPTQSSVSFECVQTILDSRKAVVRQYLCNCQAAVRLFPTSFQAVFLCQIEVVITLILTFKYFLELEPQIPQF